MIHNPPSAYKDADDDYVMGRTSEEYRRLRDQAKIWEKPARDVLHQIGLKAGMTCLDVGCGPGEVMRLMGEIVGPTGHVTGIDMDNRIGREALVSLRATTKTRFDFYNVKIEDTVEIPGAPFDVTYARLVLIHSQDPIAILRKMYAATKPGGYIVVQDCDFRTVTVHPPLKTWPLFEKILFGVFEKGGKDPRIGHKLAAHFIEAGIAQPDGVTSDSLVGPIGQYGPLLLGVYRSILPAAVQMGLTSEIEGQTFLREMSDAIGDSDHRLAMLPLLMSAWAKKPSA